MFKWLKTFRMCYELRNFSLAAEKLYISQPAVSNQLKQLEEELDCVLFVRTGKQEMTPTKAAEVLYGRVLNLADDWEETLHLMRGQTDNILPCRIGASHTFAVYYLPTILNVMIAEFPMLSFEVEMLNSEEVLEGVEKHNYHLGFIEKPLVTGTSERIELLKDELVIAGPIDSDVWLSREETSGVYHYMDHYLTDHNLNPKRMIIKNNEVIVRLLAEGLGTSIISKKALPEGVPFTELGEEYLRPCFAVKGSHLTASVYDELIERIKEIW